MSGRRTLRGRVSIVALAVIGTWVAVVALAFDLVGIHRVDRQLDDTLRIRAQAASALVAVVGGRVTGVRESATDAQLDAGTWIYSGDRVVDRPLASTRLVSLVDRVRRHRGYSSAAGHRFYVLPVRSQGRTVGTVVTSSRGEEQEDTKRTIVVGSLAVGALILIGAYPVLRFAAGRALSPVGRMAEQAAEWSSSAARERFGSNRQYAELEVLARALDGLLDRIDAVLRHERQLSGELSHELRTPLARMSGEIELLRGRGVTEWNDALAGMQESCLAMNGIIDAALAVARAELTGEVARTAVDEVLLGFVSTREPVVDVELAGLTVGVEAATVSRILNALVDNARRHARRAVRLSSAEVAGAVEISVENDGDRVEISEREQIFQPGFSRAGPEHRGAGLGLPLARRLARAADGDLWLDAQVSPTRFVLRLPRG